jgi:hypothetical protein
MVIYPDGTGGDQKDPQDVKTKSHQAQFVAEKFNGRHLGHDRWYPIKYAQSHGNENNTIIKCEFFFVHLKSQPFQFFELIFKRLIH